MPIATKEQNSLKTLKHKNRRDVLTFLRNSEEPLSALYLSKKAGLSKMTVHKILGHLVQQGLAISMGKGDPGEDGGKRPTMFTINSEYRFIFSVKIAETCLVGAVTNLRAQILDSCTITYNRDTGLAEILRHIKSMLQTIIGRLGFGYDSCAGIVIGCHGITDSESGILVTSPHFASWGSNIPIRSRIQEMFSAGIPVYVDNWVRYFSYGEATTGHASLHNFMVIGTEPEGIAAGLVLGDVLQSGSKGLSGEIGHMIVAPDNTDVCVCGGIGCLEVATSLRRMVDRAKASRNDWPDSRLFSGDRHGLTHEMIFEASNAGDVLACTIMDKAISYFAIAINNIVQTCDPGCIIIQGEYAKAGEYFLSQLKERLQRMSLLRMDKGIHIEYSDRKDEWTLIGGAHYAADRFFANMEKI